MSKDTELSDDEVINNAPISKTVKHTSDVGTIEQYIWIEKETSYSLNGSYEEILRASRRFSVHKKIWKARKTRDRN